MKLTLSVTLIRKIKSPYYTKQHKNLCVYLLKVTINSLKNVIWIYLKKIVYDF